MARFTSTKDLNIRWLGNDISGAAGATHRIPDALQDEFDATFSGRIPGLTWITQDEISAIPVLPIGQTDVSGLTAALAAKVAIAGDTVTGALNVADLQAKGGQWVDVKAHGATGDGATNDAAAIAAAIAAAPAGGVIYFPPTSAAYIVTSAVSVTKALTLQGGTVRQTSDSTQGFVVQASDVTFRGMKITRTSVPAADQANSAGISIVGSAASAPYRRVRVEGCEISNFNRYGIYGQHVVGFDIRGNSIHDAYYAGIMLLSCSDGDIVGNAIADIAGSISGNAYGISLNRTESSSLVTDPRCSDVSIVGNVVRDVTLWEGIDTHGGQRLTVVGNTVLACKTGIAIVPSGNSAQVDTYAPLDVVVQGNVIDSESTTVPTSGTNVGISFAGAGSAAGSVVEYGTGSIVGNHIRGHGVDESAATSGAIRVRTSRGMVVSGNTIIDPSPIGVVIWHTNIGYVVTGNVVIDPWANTATIVAGIATRSTHNEGFIGGNAAVRGSKTATTVLSMGIRLFSDTANSIAMLGPNNVEDATTRVSDAGPDGRMRLEATKLGFYGATPITKPIVTGSRSTGAALADLLAELELIGIIDDQSTA